MGIDKSKAPASFISKIVEQPTNRTVAKQPTPEAENETEPQAQHRFQVWLEQERRNGQLWFDQSPTHKAAQGTIGKPDFIIAPHDHPAFWVEFKTREGRFSAKQFETIEFLRELGHKVFVVYSGAQAIDLVRLKKYI